MTSQQLQDDFVRLFGVPPAMAPHLGYVAGELEMALVVGMNGRAMLLPQIAALLGMAADEAEAFATACFTRHILARRTEDGRHVYSAETFYHRLDPLSMYGGWGDVPAEARDAVVSWHLQAFIESWAPAISAIQKDADADVRIANRDVLLLSEALEQVDAASEHALALCDCRTIARACNRPVETCIRLDADAAYTVERGMGRPLTREECRELVIKLDRQGLMHTGDLGWRKQGALSGFCSCCACDCYPIRASILVGLPKAWPRSHFVAVYDEPKCNQCGACARRCHFGAFYFDGRTVMAHGHQLKCVALDAAKCWGCGLCSTGCPNDAIRMQPLSVVLPA